VTALYRVICCIEVPFNAGLTVHRVEYVFFYDFLKMYMLNNGSLVHRDENKFNFLWVTDFPLFLPKEEGGMYNGSILAYSQTFSLSRSNEQVH
jgi:aspartyl-tRNA synthetase